MITTSEFLRSIFHQGVPLGCTVEARVDLGDRRIERVYDQSGDPAGLIDLVRKYVANAPSIWFGPGLRDGCKGKDTDVAYLPVLWCDCDSKCFPDNDKAAALAALAAFAVPPSIIVDTGHGAQGYWLLREYATCAEIVDARQAMRGINSVLSEGLTRRLDAVHNPSRVMRLPNTHNRKISSDPVVCRVVSYNPDRVYSLCDFPHVEGMDSTDSLPAWVDQPCSATYNELVVKALGVGMPSWVQMALIKPDLFDKGDTSRLDWAVVLHLVPYLTLPEAELVWMQSRLGQRPFDTKVTSRPDYRRTTLLKALSFSKDHPSGR